jgi:hypothetical protein
MIKSVNVFGSGFCIVLSISASAAFAQGVFDNVSGDIAIYSGNLALSDSYNNDYSFSDGSITGVNLRLKNDFSGGWFAQLDYNTENLVDGSSVNVPDGGDYSYSVQTTSAHVGRASGNLTYGGMVSLGRDFGWWDESFTTVAAEGRYQMGGSALSGQIGSTNSSDSDASSNYGRIEGEFQISPNFLAGINVGGGTIFYDGDDSIAFVRWGVDAEYDLASGMSVFASYQGSFETEEAEEEAWQKTSISAGIRYRFGNDGSQTTFADYNPFTGVEHVRFSDWE